MMFSDELDKSTILLQEIVNLQSSYIREKQPNHIYQQALKSIMKLTDSELGLIGELFCTKSNRNYLKSCAFFDQTNIALNSQSNEAHGLEIHDLESLIGDVLCNQSEIASSYRIFTYSKQILFFSNKIYSYNYFVVLPIVTKTKIIGLIILAKNTPYSKEFIEFLYPFIRTISLIMETTRLEKVKEKIRIDLVSNNEVLRLFIKHTPLAIAVLDSNLDYVITSDQWLQQTKLTKETSFKALFADFFDNKYKDAIMSCLQGETIVCDEDYIKKEDGIYWYKLVLYPWYKDSRQIGGIIVISEDTTERHNSDAKISRMINNLKQSNAELERFAYICTHDLQEPLRSIASFINLIEKDSDNKLDERCQEYLEYIKKSAFRMKTLITDVLTYSKCNYDCANYEIYDLNDLIQNTINSLAALIKENKAKIIVGVLPTAILCNKTQIEQLFLNLIANAIKFRRKNHPPQIEVYAKKVDKHWQFSVIDNGIGIEPEYHKKIFETFQKLHTKSQYEGTGIGLSLCKKIVNLHDGDIWLVSELGKGSSFIFTLPNKAINSCGVSEKIQIR